MKKGAVAWRQRLFCSQRLAISKKYTANGLVRRGCPAEGSPLRNSATAYSGIYCRDSHVASPLERFDHNLSENNSRLLRATNNEPRPFLGLRCGVPPRQAQTNNDASGNLQRVAGRPPEYPPGRPLRNRIQAMGMNAVTGHKKNTACGRMRRGRPKGVPLWYSTTAHSSIMAGFYEPRFFSRAEGHSRRCRQFESVAA